MNYARLNHILIPNTKEDRDRLRDRWWSRVFFGPLAATFWSLSDEGRLLLGFTIVVGLAGLDVQRSESHALWAILVSLIVSSLLARRFFRLTDVRLEVSGPERVCVGEPAQFRLALRNRGDRAHLGIRVERPFLPWDGKWQGGGLRLAELAGGGTSVLSTTARFDARGSHHIDSFSAAALVPLGLALGPRSSSTGVRFTVVPRIARLSRSSRPTAPRQQPGGVALASHTGESMELVGVRPYRPGDSLRDLHAVTWARTGQPAVREYQQEFFTRVGVLMDTDPAGASEQRFEAGVSLVAGIVAHLSSGDELIDLLVTGERASSFMLGRSLGRLDQALDQLAEVEAGVFDADRLLAVLQPNLARLSAVVFVSFVWDERRRAVQRAIERAGVACRAVVVTQDRKSAAEGVSEDSSELRHVAMDDVMAASNTGPELVL